jgi:hypothetical protein
MGALRSAELRFLVEPRPWRSPLAVVWFVVGQAIGITFFYPPTPFIIGLVAFIIGLAGKE